MGVYTLCGQWTMNRFLRDNLNKTKILSRSFCTYDGILFVCAMIGQQTWTMKEFLLGAGDFLYSEMTDSRGHGLLIDTCITKFIQNP
jgi:hypothetical protein